MDMFPHISLIFLSLAVSIAISYTVLILIEYVSKRKKGINSRSRLMAIWTLGSGFFGMQLIGILTFMAQYQFTIKGWLLGLAFLTSCLLAAYVIRISPQDIHGRKEKTLHVLITAFLLKTVHFLGLSGVLDVRFNAISLDYYLLSVAMVLGISYFSFHFVLYSNAVKVTETQRFRNAAMMGIVLTLLHYTSTKTFYTNMTLPEGASDGIWIIGTALFIAIIVILLLLSSANLALVDLRALETETELLQQVRASENRFRTLAYTDQLTGIPNRHWF